jgi:dTDP-4-dehydrorhamnose 3,5-epimerase
MAKFEVRQLEIRDVLLVRPSKFADRRGYFMETYNRSEYSALGISCEFIQDNQAMSVASGTIRGLHFQHPPRAQAKLVRVLKGRVYDVAVDLRRGSPTYGRWYATILSDAGREQLFVPRGFAHGYCTLEPNTEIAYKVDEYYESDYDAGLRWNDPTIGIKWPVIDSEVVLNERDQTLPLFTEFETPFRY